MDGKPWIKAVSWNLFALAVSLILGAIYTGGWNLSTFIIILDVVLFFCYYLHELFWTWMFKRRRKP